MEAEQPESLFESRTELTAFREAVERVKQEIGRIIVGQHQMVELMIAALLADGHILIEGVPGVAKTLAAKLLSRSLDIRFSRLQFTPDLMPSDVLGTSVFNVQSGAFEFRQGPVFSQLVLIDEINRAPAKTQAALFEVMEERQITMDGTTYPMAPPFIVIATQNPIEQEGTYRLPEAQLDRFLFKIEVGYPSPEQEVRILSEFQARKGQNDLDAIRPVLTAADIRRHQEVVRGIHIEPKLIEYIVRIIDRTRNNKDLYLGASPRAAINLMTTAKALAAMRGRDFVTPEDIQYMCGPVLQHRIILTPEREMEGATPGSVVQQLVEQVEVPR
ncbi:MAG: MoxR family ATPase [Bacteroidetes bacterium]|nr:MAG: MoxR family ATPase [Bacteroidota bacterium]